MQKVALYIQDTKVDLFDDETISLTQTIQNVRDIEKVFTEFSKSFTLPASKTNNKVFKHYYNEDILNGFDARTKVDAKIELNYLPFKEGKIKLEGVDLKNNQPYAYRVVFFGNTVSLKDLFGEDKLTGLNWLYDFAIDYTALNIRTYLQTNGIDITKDSVLYSDALCVPLITITTRLYYDSNSHSEDYFNSDGTINPLGGNLYYQSTGSHIHGVFYKELKLGIKIWLIVKAIEEAYGIEFTSDSFIKDTSNWQFSTLYMWLHKEKGFPFKIEEASKQYDKFTGTYTPMTRANLTGNSLFVYGLTGGQTISYTLNINQSTGSDPYVVEIKRDGILYAQQSFTTTTGAITGSLVNASSGYTVYITGTSGNTFEVSWDLNDTTLGETRTYLGTTDTLGTTPVFRANEQMPDMKVIDFISGLFKMFNLTAYVQNDGKIKVQTLDDFYAGGTTRDVSEYVDINQSSVNVALPYKEIKFEYKGRGTILAAQYEQKEAQGWGTEEYIVSNDFNGDAYTISLPFEHMQFERLKDYNGTNTDGQVGWFADDNESPYLGLPLLFYRQFENSSTQQITFIDDASTKHGLSSYCFPSNSVSTAPVFNDDTSHFSVEINEYTNTTDFDGSLYANYYEDYITDVFNAKRRLTKVKAYLPVSFLISYSLADTLVINTKQYIINSIQTNLQTGESELELLNKL